MNFAVLESDPFRKNRMSVWNPGREDVMMKGFVEDISKSRGINRAKPGECWKKQYAILIG